MKMLPKNILAFLLVLILCLTAACNSKEEKGSSEETDSKRVSSTTHQYERE